MCLRTTTSLALLAQMRPYLGDGHGNGSQEEASLAEGPPSREGRAKLERSSGDGELEQAWSRVGGGGGVED
jgi:hypothetical protein